MGGRSTHSVLAGHTGLPTARLFDRLNEMKVGDWFVIRVLGEDHAYQVYSVETVLPTDAGSLAIRNSQDLVTLVTCTPYGVNTHRLLVHARRAPLPPGWNKRSHVASPTLDNTPRRIWFYGLFGAVIAIILVVIISLIRILSRPRFPRALHGRP
ncbi:sortase [Parascardovia denticolens]|uniref:sortase n=1 Tax=Parascardovia denticolens TaxID=78258 RepID=UPI001E504598|nr:sortase [Parascardovia denticolens]